jgi:hypothetical protein
MNRGFKMRSVERKTVNFETPGKQDTESVLEVVCIHARFNLEIRERIATPRNV